MFQGNLTLKIIDRLLILSLLLLLFLLSLLLLLLELLLCLFLKRRKKPWQLDEKKNMYEYNYSFIKEYVYISLE